MSKTLPEGWEEVKLGDVCDIKMGGTPSRNNESYWDVRKETNNLWVSIRDLNAPIIMNTEEHISNKGIKHSNAKLIHKGTLLMSFKLTIGRVAFSGTDLYTNEAIAALLPRNILQLDKIFLYYALPFSNPEQYCETAVKGMTLNLAKLKIIPLTLPKSVKEQQKIAAILMNIDNTIESTRAMIEKHKLMKQGLMQSFFNESKLVRKEFKNIVDKLIDFRGKTPKKIGMDWGGGDILALSANNVKMGYIDPSAEAYYGSEKLYLKWMKKGFCEKGDIVFTMEAPLGNVAQIPDNKKYILSQRVILLKVKKDACEPDYIAQFLQSEYFQSQLVKYSSGSTAKGIQQTKLVTLNVLLPHDRHKQKEIANILKTMDANINAESDILNKHLRIKAGLMHDLLTGNKRVKVGG